MEGAGFRPLLNETPGRPGVGFKDLAYWQAQYNEILQHPAFKDFNHRLSQLRQATVESLVTLGGLDNEGKNRDVQLRAALHILNTIIGYVPMMMKMFDEAQSRLEEQTARQDKRAKTPIHGTDLGLQGG